MMVMIMMLLMIMLIYFYYQRGVDVQNFQTVIVSDTGG